LITRHPKQGVTLDQQIQIDGIEIAPRRIG